MEHHLDPHDASQTQPAAQDAVAEAIWAVLSRLTDPEIPVVSLRDMGILRDVRRVGGEWHVVITPTYSGCPAMGQIEDDVRQALRDNGIDAQVVTQLAPAWTTDWMTPQAHDRHAPAPQPPTSTACALCAPSRPHR